MSILNLDGPPGFRTKNRRSVRVWMGIGLVIAVLGVGSTLASTISINGGQNVEFGQGVQRTVYCGGDKSITLIPISGFINNPESTSSSSESEGTSTESPSPGTFYLSGIKVDNIPDECSGKNFVISAYDNSGSNDPVAIISDANPSTTPCSDINKDSKNLCLKTASVWWVKGPQAAYWVDSNSIEQTSLSSGQSGAMLSCDRNSYLSCLGYAYLSDPLPTDNSFIIKFESDSSKHYHADINSISRIVIETQDDAFGKDSNTRSDSNLHPVPLVVSN